MNTQQKNSPTIHDVFKLITSQKEEYGIYWVANKLEKMNVPLNWGSELDGFQYSAWISNRDANFILPKLFSDWYKGGGYYQKEIQRKHGIFSISYSKGRNGNLCISLTYIKMN